MRIVVKAAIVPGMVLLCSVVDRKKMPSLAGLISIMPFTGAMARVFVDSKKGGDSTAMCKYTGGPSGELPRAYCSSS
jgi:uncharacterized membrane protein (GlpM family)